MWLRVVGFVLAALGGIVLFAVGGAWRLLPLQIAGLGLVIGCLVAGWRWSVRQYKAPAIEPAAKPAGSVHNEAPPGPGGSTGK